MKKAEKDKERAEALELLRKFLKPGDTVCTILRHVSRSGMSRTVSVVVLTPDGGAIHPNHAAHVLTGRPLVRGGMHDGLKIGGCGFDAGFDVVYGLSCALWPEGFGCIGEGCPSNDHSNGDRSYTPHVEHATGPEHVCATNPETCTAAKHWHKEPGYALRHRWL